MRGAATLLKTGVLSERTECMAFQQKGGDFWGCGGLVTRVLRAPIPGAAKILAVARFAAAEAGLCCWTRLLGLPSGRPWETAQNFFQFIHEDEGALAIFAWREHPVPEELVEAGAAKTRDFHRLGDGHSDGFHVYRSFL